jgi:hypothetical protein
MSFHKSLLGRGEDRTLGDYIQRKTKQDAFDTVVTEQKLSFKSWWESVGVWSFGNYMEVQQAESIWNAAQENK